MPLETDCLLLSVMEKPFAGRPGQLRGPGAQRRGREKTEGGAQTAPSREPGNASLQNQEAPARHRAGGVTLSLGNQGSRWP